MQVTSVAIIGSFRQRYEDVLGAWQTFSDAGLNIESPAGHPITESTKGELFVRFESDRVEWDDPTVQTVALHRILRADFVYVVAPDGYVGRTTCYEIGRALQANRPIYFSEPPQDLPLELPAQSVVSPEELLARLEVAAPSPLFTGETSSYAEWERRLINGDFLDH